APGPADRLPAGTRGARRLTVARVAALRVRAARLAAGDRPLPEPAEIDACLAALSPRAPAPVITGEEPAWLLRTELHEWKLDALRAAAEPPRPRGGPLRAGLPPPPVPGERAVRAALERCYRRLARQRQRRAEYERFIDLSHVVRPQTGL
ncbi:hypothetical protein ACWD49_35445, partial [Streptomyces sp. NPDC002530]